MAKVLNGEVQAGDRVAYATRRYSHMDMHIGRVLEVTEKDHAWKEGVKVAVLKLEVEQSTGWGNLPRKTTIGVLDRVVKLEVLNG